MILRLLFEEDEVGKRGRAAREEPTGKKWENGGWAPTEGPLAGVRPGTRPLTAGEVVENWDEVLSARGAGVCFFLSRGCSMEVRRGAAGGAA